MDTQHCLQCELHKNKIDQDGCKYCYCFFNPDKGRWVAEIENCPKLGNHSGSSEVPKDLEEASSKFATHTANGVSVEFLHEKLAFQEGAKWQKEKDDKELSEKIASAYQLGLADKEKQMMKGAEKPCHTVEEWMEHIKNADQLTKDIFSKGPYNVLYDALNHPYRDCYDAIKEFGELCYQTAREDMMKEAVEGEVMTTGFSTCDPVFIINRSELSPETSFKDGDKFRIIICKKED